MYLLYPTDNSVFWVIVGSGPFPAGPQLALAKVAVPSRRQSGMWQGIPFHKSRVTPEMLIAINTGCIFMTKIWQV